MAFLCGYFMSKKIQTDQAFLEKIIESLKCLDSAVPHQKVGIKDTNSIVRYCSFAFAKGVGVEIDNIIGKLDWLPHKEPFLDIALNEDQKVMDARETRMFLKINRFNQTLKPLLCVKSPLINPETNNVVGTIFYLFDYNFSMNFQQYIESLYKKNQIHQPNEATIKLSKREKQIIFFFLAHFSSQEIAGLLYQIENKKVTKSTIDSIFTEQLYVKFDVDNRIALHKKLLLLGYDHFIPEDILIRSSNPLEKLIVY